MTRKKEKGITERQQEIIALVAGGKMNKEIAIALDIKTQTVKNHLYKLYRKVDVENRVELTLWAIQQGVVELKQAS